MKLLARCALILTPLLLIGIGVGWLYHPAAGLIACGSLIWIDITRKSK